MPLKKQIEPSVRISVSLPWDAALRLRQLAVEGNPTLRALGILSVQYEGDSVIALRIGGQDVKKSKETLNEVADGVLEAAGTSSNNVTATVGFSNLTTHLMAPSFDGPSTSKAAFIQQQRLVNLPQNEPISSQQLQHQRRNAVAHQKLIQQQLLPPPQAPPSPYSNTATTPPVFKSPNTVCPMEGKVPLLPSPAGTLNVPRDFPFESMRQARVLQGRDTTNSCGQAPAAPSISSINLLSNLAVHNGEVIPTTIAAATSSNSQFINPPPPYPGLGSSACVSSNATVLNSTNNLGIVATSRKPDHNFNAPISSIPTATPATTLTGSNNIAISSPLLVNLLQNDGSTISGQMKSPQLPAPLTPQSPVVGMSPSAHNINASSPMRCSSTTSSDFVVTSSGTLDNGNLASPVVSSSPTCGSLMRNVPSQQQQQLLSPSSNANQFNQLPPPHRFQHAVAVRHQQQTHHQQRHHQMQSIHPRFIPPQQQFIGQQQANDNSINMQQSQLSRQQQQIRTGIPPLHQHQRLLNLPLSSPQTQQLISHGNTSPVAHSPASSQQSMHSPSMVNHHSSATSLLSPSTTPKSPLSQQLTQLQQKQKEATPISNMQHANLVPVPNAVSMLHQPPPDYNQAAANSRWPALNKPMDSVTKISFQEFTRYQIQYNLQQQQINLGNFPGQITSSEDVENPRSLTTNVEQRNQQQNITQSGQQLVSQEPQNLISVPTVGQNISDPLISLSDLDALTTNDLDALLPTLNCDLDSTLSLEDKNELESLLQDAKDLDLDLIEDNLSAVGMDVGDALRTLHDTPGCMEQPQQQSQFVDMQPFNQHQLLQNQQRQNLLQQHHQRQQLPRQLQHQQVSHRTQKQIYIQQQSEKSSLQTMEQKKLQLQQSHNQRPGTVQQRQFIINPHTGDMEPMVSDDSETEAEQESIQLPLRGLSATLGGYACFNPSSDMLLPNNLFSEEDSNSEVSSQQLPIVGSSDQDRSRDSFAAIKSSSFRPRKVPQLKGNQKIKIANQGQPTQMQQAQTVTPIQFGDLPELSKTPTLIGMVGTNNLVAVGSSKKVKPNLLREKLQQGVKERKSKDLTALNTKPKRERPKGNARAKTAVATDSASSLEDDKIKLRLKVDKVELAPVSYEHQNVQLNTILNSNNMQSQHELPGQSQLVVSQFHHPQHQPQHQLKQPQQQQHPEQHQTLQHQKQQQLLPEHQQHLQITQNYLAYNNFQNELSSPPQQGVTIELSEPRVPPLQIRLRGKNSVVVKNTRKDRKKLATSEDDQKVRQIKRNFCDQEASQQEILDGGTDTKQSKLALASQINGLSNSSILLQKSSQQPSPHTVHSAQEMPISGKTTTIVAGKNGLTISAIVEAHKSQTGDGHLATAGSTNAGSTSALLQQKQQLSKIATSLPSTITLSAITSSTTTNNSHNHNSNNTSISSSNHNSRVLTNITLKNPIKSAATITPIVSGKPMTKNHKPPPYITAVQQLHLQKQQQQQQLAAAVTMLPSATTLKRVDISKSTQNCADTTTLTVTTTPTSTTTLSMLGDRKLPVAISVNSTVLGNTENSIGGPTTLTPTTGHLKLNHIALQAVTNTSVASSLSPASVLTNTLRNSPASNGNGNPGHGNNGGGEDSGIESMDALSEKSPHQQSSSSPIQIPSQATTKLITCAAATLTTKQSSSIATKVPPSSESNKVKPLQNADDEIEKALAKMEGDFSEDLENIVANVVKEAPIPSVVSGFKLTTNSLTPKTRKINGERDVLEHDDVIKNLTDNKTSDDPKTPFTVGSPLLDHKIDEAIQVEKKKSTKGNEVHEFINSTIKEKPEPEKNLKSNSAKEIQIVSELCNLQSESLQPISIEIPSQLDSGIPRIRTRAISRLESPLEAHKLSPEAHPLTIVDTTDTAASDASVAYKVGMRATSTPCPQIGMTPSTQNINNGNNSVKRRRHESESGSANDVETSLVSISGSNNSSKRTRVSSDCSASTNNNTVSPESTGNNYILPKKLDVESSDSDEPLIEVAGKVRITKTHVDEKHMTRRSAQNQQQQIVPTQKIGKPHLNVTSCGISSTLAMQTVNSTSTTGTSNNNNNGSNLVHATRGAIAAAASSSSTSIENNQFVSAISPTDEKIGTRRSVRTSAAANKIVHNRANQVAASAEHKGTQGKAGTVTSVNISNTNASAESVAEARRKTRSAVIGESTLTEIRRRRTSRDFK